MKSSKHAAGIRGTWGGGGGEFTFNEMAFFPSVGWLLFSPTRGKGSCIGREGDVGPLGCSRARPLNSRLKAAKE